MDVTAGPAHGGFAAVSTDSLGTGRLTRPVFITGSPRSGTTLLQNLLGRDPSVYRLGRESRYIWHRLGGQEVTGAFPDVARIVSAYLDELYVGERAWTRDELRRWARRCASQGTPAQYLDLPHDLLQELSTDDVGPFADSTQTETAPFTTPPLGADWAADSSGPVRMVDKDTGHCWRLPDLAAAFPDAQFLLVVRDPVDAVRSLVAGWRHPTWFFTYRTDVDLNIRGYSDTHPWGRRWWNFNLFPGWDDLLDVGIEQLCAQQWAAAIAPMAEHGVPLVEQGRGLVVSYDRLVADPARTLQDVADFAGLHAEAVLGDGLDRTYMSMPGSAFDPGDGDVQRAAEEVRPLAEPLFQRAIT